MAWAGNHRFHACPFFSWTNAIHVNHENIHDMSNDQILVLLKKIGFPIPDERPPGQVLVRGVCPLHDGADNTKAFILFADGYACQTHGCHTNGMGRNLHGLLIALVHRASGEVMSWPFAWAWAKDNKHKLRKLVQGGLKAARPKSAATITTFTEADLLACLKIPSPYFLARGYRAETLQHFHVGECVWPLPDGSDHVGWSTIPVYDAEGRLATFTSRNPFWQPTGFWPKYMNASGPRRADIVYNLGTADHADGPIIVNEGGPCVWRFFEAGIPGAVALLGQPSPAQFEKLRPVVAGRQVCIAKNNNDAAGEVFVRKVREGLVGVEVTVIASPVGKDFGDATVDAVRSFMGRQVPLAA